MGVIKSLFDIERVAGSLSAEERTDLRNRLAKTETQIAQSLARRTCICSCCQKTKLGEAISYTLNRWPSTFWFTSIIRSSKSATMLASAVSSRWSLSRRNWLFAGSEEGGAHCVYHHESHRNMQASLRINPFVYLKGRVDQISVCQNF